MVDRYLISIQAFITCAMLGFALYMYAVVGGPAADSIGSMIVGGVMTHWFKESSAIARRAASADTVNVTGDEVTVEESQ